MISSNSKDDKAKDAAKHEKSTGTNAPSKTDAKKMDDKKPESSTAKKNEKKSDKDSGSQSTKKH